MSAAVIRASAASIAWADAACSARSRATSPRAWAAASSSRGLSFGGRLLLPRLLQLAVERHAGGCTGALAAGEQRQQKGQGAMRACP